MNFKSLLQFFIDQKCKKLYVKKLSPNDNSKNQVYLGGSFDILNILPFSEINSDNQGDWKRIRFKAKLKYYWINEDCELNEAKDAQLILYPKYPEVRFSGFLKGVRQAPSELMANRIDGRVLFLGVGNDERILGYVSGPESEIVREFNSFDNLNDVGVFKEISLSRSGIEENSREKLLSQLRRIHLLGWINSKRLDSYGKILPCSSTNCGGYTLEAELGITPNGYSEPDYLGWEVKQFSVKAFNKLKSSVITLMTPEPNGGFYVDKGLEAFIRKYGYDDKKGREARINIGGIHKYNKTTASTNLKLIVSGFDDKSGKIIDTDGYIGLLDEKENIASSWSFVSLVDHWKRKHTNACYVPSMIRKDEILYPFSKMQYSFGQNVILGNSTDFSLFLSQVIAGNIYYDPGIKLEMEIPGKREKVLKRRSQFRIKSNNLSMLYRKNEIVSLI